MISKKIGWLVFAIGINCSNCQNNPSSQQMTSLTQPNRLADSSSPYLKQHAENPVDWYPWGDEALAKSVEENKPILLSIGYSSCHWCHVMAHESFENDDIAAYMNEHFVNIKLDREQRPDIDQIYMDAIQSMGLRGGWPLNVFLTPDQKPFYGGTYFPPDNWNRLLHSIVDAYENNFEKLSESADQFAASIQDNNAEKYALGSNIQSWSVEAFEKPVKRLSEDFDSTWGGLQKSPKFPMPAIWEYLLHYCFFTKKPVIEKHLYFTLDKVIAGGIYDHIGGGFSRYSVDAEWHVPHFEKMLYDNGQLLSLYARAYKVSKNEAYRQVIEETAAWVKREMTSPDGGFYSALDADSEGEEGKFYVWSLEEFQEIDPKNSALLADYFDVTSEGNWEGTNVLRKLNNEQSIEKKYNLSSSELLEIISTFKKRALEKREQRIRPGLDDKIISGWNGLMLSGLLETYQAIGSEALKNQCIQNARFIRTNLIKKDRLLRIAGDETGGFLEDYAAIIQSFTKYYETFGDEEYIKIASQLTNSTIELFYDEGESLFYFTSDSAETLLARKKELFDNVIPSSNAIMAENLFRLSSILYKPEYRQMARQMVDQVSHLLLQEPEFLSYWSMVALNYINSPAEVLIIGENNDDFANELNQLFIPNKVVLSTKKESELPLFEFKSPLRGETTVFVCYDKVCKRPVFSMKEALEQIDQ